MKFIFSLIACFALNLNAATLEFKKDGVVVKAHSKTELEKSKKNISQKLWNAWRGYEKTYQGPEFYTLLDEVYGPSWRSARSIRFSALDGYKQMAGVGKMLESSKGKVGILASREEGLAGFTPFERKGQMVDPGPFYLVWTNFSDADKVSHGDHLKWPYQLQSIEILTKE